MQMGSTSPRSKAPAQATRRTSLQLLRRWWAPQSRTEQSELSSKTTVAQGFPEFLFCARLALPHCYHLPTRCPECLDVFGITIDIPSTLFSPEVRSCFGHHASPSAIM